MAELFDLNRGNHEPLAARMRPRTLDEYIGQDHIVGKGRLLRRAIAADQLTSVIFYGPPGSGKTTLARVIANHTSSAFITLNAVLTGVADIRKAIAQAEEDRKLYEKKTILFVDEVHRWNKSQQDALLPWVENGTIILIGATTENPFFEVNKALVSRSRVFQLKPLTNEDLMKAALQAIKDPERGYGHWKVEFEKGALEHLVQTASGDARSLLNALELAVETTPPKWSPTSNPPLPAWGSTIYISRETAEESIQKKVVLYDRDGDYHYDIISAFIKSLRGRDPDAACYWLAKMVKAGEDPSFIFRRMLISACEDTGLADPKAISVVESCAAAFERVGMPEGRFFLAHAALYLATCPKSNSSMAFFDALASVEKEDTDVPNHLKDASRDAEGFGHGNGYLYPHAYKDHWVAQQYLPDELAGRVFYTPSTQGYENKIRDEVLSRREIQIASLLEEKKKEKSFYNENADKHPGKESIFEKEDENPVDEWWKATGHFRGLKKTEENLTFTPENKAKESVLSSAEKHWRSRVDSNRAEVLMQIRDTMILDAEILRHHRILIWNADDMILIFEACRKAPEGLVAGLCKSQAGMQALLQYSSTLSDLDRPEVSLLKPAGEGYFTGKRLLEESSSFGELIFDRAFFRDVIASKKDIENFASSLENCFLGDNEKDVSFGEENFSKKLKPVFSKDTWVILSQRIPCHGQKLSLLLKNEYFKDEKKDEELSEILTEMEKAEDAFFSNPVNPLFDWDAQTIQTIFQEHNIESKAHSVILTEKRHISNQDIKRWFDNESSAYGNFISSRIGIEKTQKIADLFIKFSSKQLWLWKTENVFFTFTYR